MPVTWNLPLFTFVAPGGFTAASRPSDWSTGGISNEDGVEALCDSSFLQTSFHTEQVLSTGKPDIRDIRKPMSQESPLGEAHDAHEAPAASLALSFFQVEEVLSSDTGDAGDGVTVVKELAISPGLDSDLQRLKMGTFWLKAIFILLFLWKGGLAFTRLLRRGYRRSPEKEKAAPVSTEVETSVVPPESFRELKVEEQTPQSVPTLNALEVQQLLPAFSGYDCALSKPKSLGRPFRLRARIYGPSDNVEPILAPMTEEACVLCTTKVQLIGEAREATVILERSESVDFLANLEGAPDLQVMVNAKDVRTCMKSQSLQSTFESVPKKLQELVEAEAGAKGWSPETPLVIQEDLLRVGDMVTLVGDLHRDAAGRLTIWPPTPPKRERNHVYELMDGMHVLISDEESFGGRKEDP